MCFIYLCYLAYAQWCLWLLRSYLVFSSSCCSFGPSIMSARYYVHCDFHITAIFGSSLPTVVYRRAHVLYISFVFIYSCTQQFVLLYVFTFSVPCCDAFPLRFPHTNDVRFAFHHQLFVGGSCTIE